MDGLGWAYEVDGWEVGFEQSSEMGGGGGGGIVVLRCTVQVEY